MPLPNASFHGFKSVSCEMGRGDELTFSEVNPIGRFWLGRLGPKDFVTLPDERSDRLEPCAIGLRMKPAHPGPWTFNVVVSFCIWKRSKSEGKRELPWKWDKIGIEPIEVPLSVQDVLGETIYGTELLTDRLKAVSGINGLSAEIRVRVLGKTEVSRALEVTIVNTGQEPDDFASGRLFECNLSVSNFNAVPFALEALPETPAFYLNCPLLEMR